MREDKEMVSDHGMPILAVLRLSDVTHLHHVCDFINEDTRNPASQRTVDDDT